MILTGENVSTRRKTFPNVTLSNPNPQRQEMYGEYDVANEILKHGIMNFLHVLRNYVLVSWINLCMFNKTTRKHV